MNLIFGVTALWGTYIGTVGMKQDALKFDVVSKDKKNKWNWNSGYLYISYTNYHIFHP